MITKLAWALKKISFNDLLSFQPCKIYSLDLVHYMYILHESFSYTTIIPLLVIWPTNRRFFYRSRTYKFCMICGYHLPFSKDKMLIRFLSLQPKLLSLFHNTHPQAPCLIRFMVLNQSFLFVMCCESCIPTITHLNITCTTRLTLDRVL